MIPNSLWKSMAFTAVCMVPLSWAVMQSLSFLQSFVSQSPKKHPGRSAGRGFTHVRYSDERIVTVYKLPRSPKPVCA